MFKDWLKAWDLKVYADLFCKKECVCYHDGYRENGICNNKVVIYYIGTFEDRSVGIERYSLSPSFESVKELEDWWNEKANRELIEKGLED